MYGGIHYRAAVEVGIKQGRDLGKFVVDNLQMTSTNLAMAPEGAEK